MTCGIYLITHYETGKKYVGQSINIKNRLSIHARGYSKTILGRTILKYNWSSFNTEILQICERALLNDAEKQWIVFYDCVSPKGFNLTSGGNQAEFSIETIQKLRKAQQNRSPEHIANKNAAASRPETRAKISESLKGRVFSDKTKNLLREAKKGFKYSDESKASMSASAKIRVVETGFVERMIKIHKGTHHSENHRAKISAANSNPSAEVRANMSAGQIGRVHSPEVLAVMREVRKSAEWKLMCAKGAKGKKQSPEQIAKRIASTKATKAKNNLSTNSKTLIY
jgi:group I intron endonuclease